MVAVNIFKAKSTLSKLIADLESKAVREVVIARHGRPVAKLVALVKNQGTRIGVAEGQFVVPNDIDTDNEVAARLFRGELA